MEAVEKRIEIKKWNGILLILSLKCIIYISCCSMVLENLS